MLHYMLCTRVQTFVEDFDKFQRRREIQNNVHPVVSWIGSHAEIFLSISSVDSSPSQWCLARTRVSQNAAREELTHDSGVTHMFIGAADDGRCRRDHRHQYLVSGIQKPRANRNVRNVDWSSMRHLNVALNGPGQDKSSWSPACHCVSERFSGALWVALHCLQIFSTFIH